MAFNNYFPTGYQPAQIYYPQAQPSPQQTQQATPQGLIWVQGEAGAKSYLVAPNSTVVLWDSEAHTIYIKSADATGMPNIKTLDYVMRGNAPEEGVSNYATREEVIALKDEISELKKRLAPKGKEKTE
jgi:hypothetical protein